MSKGFVSAPKFLFLDSTNFSKKKLGDLTLSNIPSTNTTRSSSITSTTSTSSIPSTNRRRTDLHPYIYSRLCLFQIRTAASGTEAENIRLFRTSLNLPSNKTLFPLGLWVVILNLRLTYVHLDIVHIYSVEPSMGSKTMLTYGPNE